MQQRHKYGGDGQGEAVEVTKGAGGKGVPGAVVLTGNSFPHTFLFTISSFFSYADMIYYLS